MTTRPPKYTRPVLDPSLVRDILEGVGRDRPELLRDSAVPAPRAPARSSTNTLDLDALVDDLLRGIPHEDRPAVVEHARLVARSQLWLRDFDHASAAAIRNGEGDYLAIVERLQRMKDRESAIYTRHLLVIEMMRTHQLQIQATAVHRRRRTRGPR